MRRVLISFVIASFLVLAMPKQSSSLAVVAHVTNWWEEHIWNTTLMETVKVAVETELRERWEKYKKTLVRQLAQSVRNLEDFLWSEFLCLFKDVNIDFGSFELKSEWELKGRCTTTKIGYNLSDQLKWKIRTSALVSDLVKGIYEGYMSADDVTINDAFNMYIEDLYKKQTKKAEYLKKHSRPLVDLFHQSIYNKSYSVRVIEYLVTGQKDKYFKRDKEYQKEPSRVDIVRATFYKGYDPKDPYATPKPKSSKDLVYEFAQDVVAISAQNREPLISSEDSEEYLNNQMVILATKELPTVENATQLLIKRDNWKLGGIVAETKPYVVKDIYLGYMQKLRDRDLYVQALWEQYKNLLSNLPVLKQQVDDACDEVTSDSENETPPLICTQMKLKLADMELKLFQTKMIIVQVSTQLEMLNAIDYDSYREFEKESLRNIRR